MQRSTVYHLQHLLLLPQDLTTSSSLLKIFATQSALARVTIQTACLIHATMNLQAVIPSLKVSPQVSPQASPHLLHLPLPLLCLQRLVQVDILPPLLPQLLRLLMIPQVGAAVLGGKGLGPVFRHLPIGPSARTTGARTRGRLNSQPPKRMDVWVFRSKHMC